VGTHQSLKAKAAIKEAIRMSDDTPFGSLPSFVQASGEWLDKNRNRVEGLGEEDINCLYEEDMFSHMPLKERMTKRRIRLADKITADIAQCAGLPRGYKNEKDYFFGGVYGEVPDYWDTGNMPPSGSAYAARYFDQQHERAKSNGKTSVKELVLSMLNIQKAPGVHAGGFLIGREILRRVPLRADNNGFVGQLHMGECETVGILKFDVLGLSNLNYISDTLRLIIQTHSYDKLSWWLKDKDAYDQVRSGKSPDILWRFVPKSTLRAAEVLANRRAMIFQVDTNVVARELDKFDASEVFKRIKECPYDEKDPRNFVLTDFLSAVLALFRPGPMKMGEHIKYLERFRGAKYELIHPWLGPFLNTTYGIIAYQEQVMAITKAGGGFSDAQTDNIRRAMGKKKISALEAIEKDGVKGAANIFITGCVTKHGVDEDSAAKIWELIEPFAEYGFNIAHSYHYGIISAMTLFLKAYYEKEFFRVVMGISDPKDSARFLKEIAAHTQSPCALNSDRTFWEIEKNEYASEDADENAKESAWYFPGLSSVEKIQHSMIDRILSVRDGLTKEQVRSLKPQEFFERLGELSKSQARLLASSGLLRNLGTAEEIADGYERALVETILPQKDREKKRKELAKREEISLDKASGGESE
jgi:DNA polymerase III alpha subunit